MKLTQLWPLAALLGAVTLGGALWGASRWLGAPAAVPDHATVFTGTQPMLFAGSTTLGQRIVPQRDGLRAVDLLLAAEGAELGGMVRMDILDPQSRETIRTAQVPARRVPSGSVWELRPGGATERWTTFGFEPVPNSAGRDLLMILSYSDGRDVPGGRLATLAHFPGTYPLGQMLINGTPQKGNLLFRLAGSGTRRDATGVAMENLARVQPVARGTLVFPAVLLLLCVTLAAAVIWRVGSPSPEVRPDRQGTTR